MQYYAAGDQWQISDVSYRMMKPKDPGNIQLLSEGHEPYYTETTLSQLMAQTVLTDEMVRKLPMLMRIWRRTQAPSCTNCMCCPSAGMTKTAVRT